MAQAADVQPQFWPSYYIPKLRRGELKKILFIPTGALLSPVSFNEGDTVPGIAHGVVLEACDNNK